jgi:hypothetical protein
MVSNFIFWRPWNRRQKILLRRPSLAICLRANHWRTKLCESGVHSSNLNFSQQIHRGISLVDSYCASKPPLAVRLHIRLDRSLTKCRRGSESLQLFSRWKWKSTSRILMLRPENQCCRLGRRRGQKPQERANSKSDWCLGITLPGITTSHFVEISGCC